GTPRRFWRRLRQAGVEVRAFHPLLSLRPFELLSRDHRKLVVADGTHAMTGGLCVGDEWAGDPARRRLPWRDTMLAMRGSAVPALDRAFGRVWRRAGAPLPPDELAASVDGAGGCTARVVEGRPGGARVYRAVQLLAAGAAQRLWITDAYLIPPAPLYASLLDAARDGVDVRLLVPGTSDVPVVRNFTRVGYRELLRAGVRVFEYQGPMLHAKTLVADRPWAGAAGARRRVAGGLRRAIAWTAALTCAGVGALLLLFPRVTSIVLAAGTFWLAATFGLYALERRRARDYDDDGL